jgi:hypothetical protein
MINPLGTCLFGMAVSIPVAGVGAFYYFYDGRHEWEFVAWMICGALIPVMALFQIVWMELEDRSSARKILKKKEERPPVERAGDVHDDAQELSDVPRSGEVGRR